MPDLPPEIQRVLSLIYETIDRSIDAEIKRLDESRAEKHQEAERFVMSLLQGAVPMGGTPITAPQQPLFSGTNGNGNGSNGRKRPFQMREVIKKIIADAPDDAEIDQQSIYDRLTTDYPALRDRVEGHLRGQISGVLGRLRDEGFIILVKRGMGGAPHVYQRNLVSEVV
jgi:hypothetical protein